MLPKLEASLLRILDKDGATVGAGFVVGKQLAVTCAHVAEAAGAGSAEEISLVFHAKGQSINAVVLPEYWRASDREDVAFLYLIEPVPADILPALLGTSRGIEGHPLKTLGFPSVNPEGGVLGEGHILGETIIAGIRMLQISSHQITSGFSGAPVHDTLTRRVVGMCTSITTPQQGRLAETAFITPTEILQSIHPDLKLSDLSPYRGLEFFTEEHADFFFGRERFVDRMLDSLRREPRILAILGPSGSGKSSVVQAGLIPRLREGIIPGSDLWKILITRPVELLSGQYKVQDADSVSANLIAYKKVIEDTSTQKHVLLVVDQFEELLIEGENTPFRGYLDLLLDLLENFPEITIIIVMRDDFYSRLSQQAPPLMKWIEQGIANIPANLEPHELRAMVWEPANAIGLKFERGLVDAIVNDVMDLTPTMEDRRPGVRSTILPLLEFTLNQLWEKRKDGVLTHEDYRAIGSVTGGLTQWADRAYFKLAEQDRPLARRILTDLVYLRDEMQGFQDTRRRRSLDALCRNEGERNRVQDMIRHLVNARLVVTAYDQKREIDMVEIVHDALLWEWSRFQRWLREDRRFQVWRQDLEKRASDWNGTSNTEDERDEGKLLRGGELAVAEEWLKKRGDDLGQVEQIFIYYSLALREHTAHNLAQAYGYYRQALEIDSTLAEINHNLHLLLLEKGELDLALDEYNKAIAIKSKLAIVPPGYKVDKILNAGGPFVVYQAIDEENEVVVFKILARSYETEETIKALRVATARSQQLEHPNIVGIEALDRLKNRHYIMRKYVAGQSMQEIIDERGPLSLNIASDILIQICSTLEEVHSQGIVHGNIKPTNIYKFNEQFKLTDLGLAPISKMAEYMAPEQKKGFEIPETDVYALATVFFEMLTHRKPSEKISRSELDNTLELVLEIARAPIPDERYPSIVAFMDELSQVIPLQIVTKNVLQRVIALTANIFKMLIIHSWHWLLVASAVLGLIAPMLGEANNLREVIRILAVLLALIPISAKLVAFISGVVAHRVHNARIAAYSWALGALLALVNTPIWLKSIDFQIVPNLHIETLGPCTSNNLLPPLIGLGQAENLSYFGEALIVYLIGSVLTTLFVFGTILVVGSLSRWLNWNYMSGFLIGFLFFFVVLLVVGLSLPSSHGWFGGCF